MEDNKNISSHVVGVGEQGQQREDNSKKTNEIIPQNYKSYEMDEFLKLEDGQELFNSIYRDTLKTIYYYSKKSDIFNYITTEKELLENIELDFPQFFKIIENEKGKKTKISLLPHGLITKAKQVNTISMISKEVNFFQKNKVELSRVGSILYISKNYLEFRKLHFIDVLSQEQEQEILKDYNEQWELKLNEVLDWIVDCRFSHSRRQSFLHLKLNAGFGKSFFSSILKEIGLFVEADYEDFKNPSPMDSVEFENAIGIVIDEFTIFKKDFKKFTHSMTLTPKYKLRTEVKLYAKLFLSAEESSSFVDGVDKQISDRVCSIKMDKGNLKDREVYKKYGAKTYYDVILKYIFGYINNKIKKYIELGEYESSNISDENLSKFHKKYELNTKNLDDMIRERFYLKIYELYNEVEIVDNNDRNIYNNVMFYNGYIFIKQPKKTFELIIKSFDEDFYKKSKYKVRNYQDIIKLESKNYKIDGKTYNSMRIKIIDLENIIKENFGDIINIESKIINVNGKDIPLFNETIKN